MSEERTFEIRVQDLLDDKWAAYFAPFSLAAGQEGTILTGIVHDQAELFGILLKVRDSGIQLVSVKPVF